MPAPEHFWTPATVLTLSRPLLGLKVAHKLLAGENHALPWAVATGLTDLEGGVARVIDGLFPDSGRGSTKTGVALDPIADTVAGLEITTASLFAPRVSTSAKLAAGLILVSESMKAAWAIRENMKYRAETGEQLIIRPAFKGKLGTASKMVAISAIVATNDLRPGKARTVLGWGAFGLAVAGACLTEIARRQYDRDLAD